jgi:uncharacterized membrane protein YfcA
VTILGWLAAVAIIATGAAVQGSVGFGLGVLGAPLLALIDPRLVPGPLLLDALLLTFMVAVREWKWVRLADLAWALPGRLAGTVIAVLLMRAVPAERFQVALGVLILAAVALSKWGPRLPLNPRTLTIAGVAAGIMSTFTSIGGPPMALVYQHEEGPRVRGTLAAFFTIGVIFSMGGLRVAGRFGWTEVRLAAWLLPGVVLGFVLSRWSARWLDRGHTRALVLATSAVAAVLVVVKGLLAP